MNEYTVDHISPTLEHYFADYKRKKGVKIYTPGACYGEIQRWGRDFFKEPKLIHREEEAWNSDIAIIDDSLSPYEMLKVLCKAFEKVKQGGLIACNHFFENKPQDDFEMESRYGIDAFCFVVQYRIDILYKGNQIIMKKL